MKSSWRKGIADLQSQTYYVKTDPFDFTSQNGSEVSEPFLHAGMVSFPLFVGSRDDCGCVSRSVASDDLWALNSPLSAVLEDAASGSNVDAPIWAPGPALWSARGLVSPRFDKASSVPSGSTIMSITASLKRKQTSKVNVSIVWCHCWRLAVTVAKCSHCKYIKSPKPC